MQTLFQTLHHLFRIYTPTAGFTQNHDFQNTFIFFLFYKITSDMIKFLQNSFAHCSNGQSPPRGKLYGVMDTTTRTIVTCLSSKRRRIKYICHNATTLTCGFWAASLEGLDAQLVGDGHEHFEDGHEGGDFTEVAAADHLGVDLQAPLVVLARHAAADLVEPAEDVLGELGKRPDVRYLHQTPIMNK